MRYGEAMTIKPLIILPDPLLRQQSKPIEQVDAEITRLADDMLDTMYDAPGIGLAAIQIGVPRRMLVIDISREDEDRNPVVFINPEILKVSDDVSAYEEGCLSVPEIYDEVQRPAHVKIRYLNYQGEQVEEDAHGLYAVCIQHEMDHLEGVLFIDHLSRLKRDRAVAKVKKAAKAA